MDKNSRSAVEGRLRKSEQDGTSHTHNPQDAATPPYRGTRERSASQSSEESPGFVNQVKGLANNFFSPRNSGQPNAPDLARYQQLEQKNTKLANKVGKQDLHIEQLCHENAALKKGQRSAFDRMAGLAEDKHQLERHVHKMRREQEDLMAQNHQLQKANTSNAKAIEALKGEAVQYKIMISKASCVEDQMADNVIEGRLSKIYFDVQEFVLRNCQEVEFDYSALPESIKLWMHDHVPRAEAMPKSLHIWIVISVLGKTLTDAFDLAYAFGYSQEEPIRSAATLASLRPDLHPDTKQWFESTRKAIFRHDSEALEKAETELVYNMIGEVHSNLSKALPIEWTHHIQGSLAKIFASCLELYRSLRSQAAIFYVDMVHAAVNGTQYPFDPEGMVDVNGQAEDRQHKQQIDITLFPIICKRGDERGEKIEILSVVAKARVMVLEHARAASDGGHGQGSTGSARSNAGQHSERERPTREESIHTWQGFRGIE